MPVIQEAPLAPVAARLTTPDRAPSSFSSPISQSGTLSLSGTPSGWMNSMLHSPFSPGTPQLGNLGVNLFGDISPISLVGSNPGTPAGQIVIAANEFQTPENTIPANPQLHGLTLIAFPTLGDDIDSSDEEDPEYDSSSVGSLSTSGNNNDWFSDEE